MSEEKETAWGRFVSAFRSSGAWKKLFLALACVCHAAFLLNLSRPFLSPLSHDMTLFRAVRGADFNAVYMAGRYATQGANLYRAPLHEEAIAHTRYRYTPPVAFLLGIPFSLIPNPRAAYWFWIIITEFILFVNIYLTIRFCPREERIIPAVLLWLLFFPYAVELFMGQFSFFTASLGFWCVLALLERRETRATVLWIPMALLKLFPLWLAPFFWKKIGPGKTLAALFLIAALVAPYLAFHKTDASDFFLLNFQMGKEPLDKPYFGNQGLYHFILQFRQGVPEIPPRVIPSVIYGLGIVLLAAFFRLCLKNRKDPVLLFSLGMALFFIISLEIWEHHYVLLLPLFVLYFIFRERAGMPFFISYILCALPTLYFFVNPSASFRGTGGGLSLNSSEVYLYFAIKPLGAILFIIILFRDLRRK